MGREVLLTIGSDPYEPGILFMGHRETEMPQMRRRKTGRPTEAILFAYMNFIGKNTKQQKTNTPYALHSLINLKKSSVKIIS